MDAHQVIGALPKQAYTSWIRRVGAFIIDQILWMILSVILGCIGGLIVGAAGGSSRLEGIVQSILTLVVLAYGIWNWGYRQGRTGSSIGKSVLKFKVVSERDGQPIGFGLSVVRYFAHFLDAICYIGYLLPLFTAKRQTIADMIMNTVCLPIEPPGAPSERRSRTPWIIAGAAAVVVAIVAVVAFVFVGHKSALRPSQTQTAQPAQPSAQSKPLTYTVTTTIPVGKNPNGLAVDPDSHTVYVANGKDNTVSVLDGTTRAVTTTIPVGQDPGAVAVDPGTHSVFVANFKGNSVSVLDGTTRAVTTTIPVGLHPEGVAVDPDSHTVFVANFTDNTVSVLDGTTHAVTTTIPVGQTPVDVAVDPDSHTVFVTNTRGNTVSVLDGTTHGITTTIPVGQNPNELAVDVGSHTVYATNAGDNTVSVLGGHT
jgi:YVTN family beta-propeller protein